MARCLKSVKEKIEKARSYKLCIEKETVTYWKSLKEWLENTKLQFYGNTFENVNEIEDFLAKYKLPELTQKEVKAQLTSYPRRN